MSIRKTQLSLFGTKLKEAFTPSSPIKILETPKVSGVRPFKSQPIEKHTVSSQFYHDDTLVEDEDLPKYTLREILEHDTAHDCWIIVYDRVYDVTNFLHEHPGGEDIILEFAGRDATLAFRSVGHDKIAEKALESNLVGILVPEDRIWTHLWGIRRGSR